MFLHSPASTTNHKLVRTHSPLFPKTPKGESQNCPGFYSRDFGNSYLLALTSDWSEVSTKVVGLLENFSILCHTPSADVTKRSILDF
jgi:hypothetical protein